MDTRRDDGGIEAAGYIAIKVTDDGARILGHGPSPGEAAAAAVEGMAARGEADPRSPPAFMDWSPARRGLLLVGASAAMMESLDSRAAVPPPMHVFEGVAVPAGIALPIDVAAHPSALADIMTTVHGAAMRLGRPAIEVSWAHPDPDLAGRRVTVTTPVMRVVDLIDTLRLAEAREVACLIGSLGPPAGFMLYRQPAGGILAHAHSPDGARAIAQELMADHGLGPDDIGAVSVSPDLYAALVRGEAPSYGWPPGADPSIHPADLAANLDQGAGAQIVHPPHPAGGPDILRGRGPAAAHDRSASI